MQQTNDLTGKIALVAGATSSIIETSPRCVP